MAQLLSANIGLPRDIEWKGKRVYTAVWKDAVQGPRKVGKLNIDGDGQGDLQGHGGEHRAVLVYQIDSYRAHLQFASRRYSSARNREDHPFREGSRALLQKLKYGHSYIQYSRPGPTKGVSISTGDIRS